MWAAIPNYEGYEVSDKGEVRCWNPANGKGNKNSLAEPRYLTPSPFQGKKYLKVGITNSKTGKTEHRRVHQLVLEAFVGPMPIGSTLVLHKDDDPTNNCLSNLAYGSSKENSEDMVSKGRSLRGELHPRSIASNSLRSTILAMASANPHRGSKKAIAESLGIPVNTIYRVIATESYRKKHT